LWHRAATAPQRATNGIIATLNMTHSTDYTPALGFHALTNLYDWLMERLMRDISTKQRLVRQIGAEAGQKVIDVGCGTGTLSILLKRQFTSVEVVGVDIDLAVLRIASKKCSKAGVDITFRQGPAHSLLFEIGSFDHAVSSFVFHHLSVATKRKTLREIARVLRPGGKFHLLDWGKGATAYRRAVFTTVRLLDGFETTRENARGQLSSLLTEAGFTHVTPTFSENVVLGTLQCFEATRS
jgi:ubiquinone/menaquinone biosynthesis C-methylase UbiE